VNCFGTTIVLLNEFEITNAGARPTSENIRAVKRLVSRFNQSSLELIQEYRWLEARADYLVERRRETLCYHEEKISVAMGQYQ